MRKKEWPTKKLFYEHLNKELRKIFGDKELKVAEDYISRYLKLSEVLNSSKNESIIDVSYERSNKISTAYYGLQELPIQIQSQNQGEKILIEILNISQFESNIYLAHFIVTDDEISVSQTIVDKAIEVLRKSVNNRNDRYEIQMILDEIDGKYKRLKEDTRQSLRLFGYYLFNGTINWEILQEELKEDYLEYLKENPLVFGQACSVYINNFKNINASERCAKWIRKCIEPSYKVMFEDWEIDFQVSGKDIVNSFKKMVIEISEERFRPDLLKGKYFSSMVDSSASFLERTFAIWSNVIKMDNNKIVINLDQAEKRTAQWIKYNVEKDYKIEPPLEDWETELH